MINFFAQLLYYPLLNLMTFFIWATPGHFAAVSIILLTLVVRFILLVPSKRAAQAQRRLAQLTPLMEELKKEYGNDKQGLAAAQMELYKRNSISPFSSCVPILIQFPILILLYTAIRNGLTPHDPHLYSWLPTPEFINTNFFGIDLIGPDHSYVLPILAAVGQYFQVKMTTPPLNKNADGQVDPATAATRNMMYIMPALTLFIAVGLPAGVALYWITGTIFSIIQQRQVNKEKYNIAGVDKALETADKKHPEHRPRTGKIEENIQEETSTKKGGVSVVVRRKK
jgi:YidC/Oxa1 family membrane protein insertase